MNKNDLLGLKYPITAANTGEFCGTKTIKNVADIENYAGYLISLRDDTNSFILIGYKEAEELIKNNIFSKLIDLDKST